MPYFKQQKLYAVGLGPRVELWMSSLRNWNLLFIILQTSADYTAKTEGFAGGRIESWDSTGLSKFSPVAHLFFFYVMLATCLSPDLKRQLLWLRSCYVHSAHGFLRRQQTSLTITSGSALRPQTSQSQRFSWTAVGQLARRGRAGQGGRCTGTQRCAGRAGQCGQWEGRPGQAATGGCW